MADEQKPEGGHPAPKAPPAMASTPWESELAREVREQFGDAIADAGTYLGQDFLRVDSSAAVRIIEYLKLEAGYDFMADLTAVHYPNREKQFEIVYLLYSFDRNHRLRINTAVADGATPETACFVHTTANWLEREVFDMFGVRFEGHPDMRRLLLPEDWQGYPLRKEKTLIDMDNAWVKENLGIESGQ
jgi:NADH-quinone oxidoreductase subunit C